MTDTTFLSPAVIGTLFNFSIVTSITPGPNNIMLATGGVNFGVRRTFAHMAAITVGLLLIVPSVGLGLGTLFTHYPLVRNILEAVGVAYTLYLSYRIATAGSLGGSNLPHPMTFGAAFAFQWVNVKLWLMAISTVALYVRPGHALADTLVVVLVGQSINIPVMFIWAGFGAALRDFLKVPGRIRVFNAVMGLLLAASVLAVLRI